MGEPPIPGDTHLHRFEIHKRVTARLHRTAGVTAVRASPSPMRPVRIEATVDRETFFDRPDRAGELVPEATLEFEWRPRPDRDGFRVQYIEPGTPWSCGWHQDGTHQTLGASHFQVDHEEWEAPHRKSSSFTDPNPMAVLETCLDELRGRVPGLPGSVR